MNPTKPNGWILCPSKRIPGKYYFFNTLTGEAIWDLKDLERPDLQRDIHRVTNNWHNYPEPDIPPDNPNVNWRYTSNYERPAPFRPNFGQQAFPRHQETLNKDIMWIPVQKPPAIQNNQESFHHKNWPDGQQFQNCGTPQRNMWLTEPKIEVQDHMSYRNTFDTNNKWTNNSYVFGQKTPSNMINSSIFGPNREILRSARFEIKRNESQPVINRPIFTRTQSRSEPQSYMNSGPLYGETSNNLSLNDKPVINRPIFTRTQSRSEPQSYMNSGPLYGETSNNLSLNDEPVINRPIFTRTQSRSEPQSYMNSGPLYGETSNNLSLNDKPVINRPVFNRTFNRSETQGYMNSGPLFRDTSNNLSLENKPESQPVINRMIFNRTQNRSEPQVYMNSGPLYREPSNNLSLENKPESQSVINRPISNRTQNRSETQLYMNSGPLYREPSIDNSTDSTVGIWTLSPTKRAPIPTQSDQKRRRISIFSPREEPDFESMASISPMKNSMKTETNLFGNMTLNSRPLSNRTTEENSNHFVRSLSPVKKVQYPQTETFPNNVQSKSDVDITVEETLIELSNLCPKKWVETLKTNEGIENNLAQNSLKTNEGTENNLEKNDLRYLLLARKRKFDTPDARFSDTGKRKINLVAKKEAVPSKKRVSFDLDVEVSDDEMPQGDDVPPQEGPQDLTIEALRDMAAPTANSDCWYIAVNTEVLLEDFAFIDDYVRTDDKCSLLIAPGVRSEIEAMSVGDCRGRQHVMSARHLSRLFAAPTRHITVLPADETFELSTDNSILSSCMQMIDQNYHVVLIVKNPEMYKGTTLNLNCFELQEIKNGAAKPKPEVVFELTKTQISFNNNNITEKNNEFLKTACVFNPFSVKPKDQHNNSRVVFHNNQKQQQQQSENQKPFSSNIFPPKITQSNQKVTFGNGNDVLPTTSQMSRQTNDLNKTFDFQKDSLAGNENCSSFKYSNQPQMENTADIRKIQTINTNDLNKAFDFQEISLAGNENCSSFKCSNQPQMENTADIRKIQTINSYNIEDHLKKFCIKSTLMEETVKVGMEEWMCCFTQIMEDILSDVLRVSTTTPKMLPPWSVSDAVECLGELYGDNMSIKILDEKLTSMLNKFNPAPMLPSDFMKIFGCGLLLIKSLKTILPRLCPQLSDAENSLIDLLLKMENPPEPVDLAGIKSKRSSDANSEDCCVLKPDFIKKPEEVLMYLKAYFPEWQTNIETNCIENIEEQPQLVEEPPKNIVRTVGKNLNLLKLDTNKTISLNQTNGTDTPKVHSKTDNKFSEFKRIDLEKREEINKDFISMLGHIVNGEVHKFEYKPKIIEKKVKNKLSVTNEDNVQKDTIINNNVTTENGDLLINNQESAKENVEPKTMGISNEEVDWDMLDYEENDDTSQMAVDDSEGTKVLHKIKNGNEKVINVDTAKKDNVRNDNCDENNGDFSIDSGYEHEIRHAPSIVITFLCEVSVAFKTIYKFINASMVEYRRESIQDTRKTIIHEKAKNANTQISYIIDRLKSIMLRESVKGSALADLMKNAGIDMPADVRLSRYRQVVTKCLEQAEILQNALKVIISIAEGKFDSSSTTDSVSPSIKYINIFEN